MSYGTTLIYIWIQYTETGRLELQSDVGLSIDLSPQDRSLQYTQVLIECLGV